MTTKKRTPGYLGPPAKGTGNKLKKRITTPPGGGSPGPVVKPDDPKKAQQKLARRVKDAALASGMDWAEWSEKRKELVGAFRVKGSTKKSQAAVKQATKLIRKSEGKAAAKSYAKRAASQDKRGAKSTGKSLKGPGGRPNPTSVRPPGYQGGPTRKKKRTK